MTIRRSVVFCGPVCSGKSSAARSLQRGLGLPLATARDAIERTAGRAPLAREDLQAIGRALEEERPGIWLAEAVDGAVGPGPAVIDSARTRAQVTALGERQTPAVVVHLSASFDVRRSRYVKRAAAPDAMVTFESLAATEIEREAEALRDVADIVVDTSNLDPSDVVACVSAELQVLLSARDTDA